MYERDGGDYSPAVVGLWPQMVERVSVLLEAFKDLVAGVRDKKQLQIQLTNKYRCKRFLACCLLHRRYDGRAVQHLVGLVQEISDTRTKRPYKRNPLVSSYGIYSSTGQSFSIVSNS